MSIFSRLSDILNANITSLLDRAEDPEKMARLMLQEMEETLVDVRSDAARLIADKKDVERQLSNIEASITDWTAKATLALKCEREDLARHALAEKQQAQAAWQEKQGFLQEMEQQLTRHDDDIKRLQDTMKQARKRLESLRLRKQVNSNRLKMREHSGRITAFARNPALNRWKKIWHTLKAGSKHKGSGALPLMTNLPLWP